MSWEDEVFSSAEAAELEAMFERVAAEHAGGIIQLDVRFTTEEAREFLGLVRKAQFDPYAAHQCWAFLHTLAHQVHVKMRGG